MYRLDSERSLVQTVDFFTPIVDDPFVYGQIAAANALSDVYAMGGRPLTALAIAAFPKDADRSVLATIFKGGLDKLAEAGVALLGGHTVQDTEIKFGYAVTGEVLTARIWSNAGAHPGDELVLTKALGTGIISTALKFERAPEEALAAAIRSMIMLNRVATETLQRLPADAVHACTDVTGFGLIGHASEMAAASRCTLEIDAARDPPPARRPCTWCGATCPAVDEPTPSISVPRRAISTGPRSGARAAPLRSADVRGPARGRFTPTMQARQPTR